MYHTETFLDSWKNTKQSTAEQHYPKRLVIRLGHLVFRRLISANPNGYPTPGRDGRGRVIVPTSLNSEAPHAGVVTLNPIETTSNPPVSHDSLPLDVPIPTASDEQK